jgi:hypothetical protein
MALAKTPREGEEMFYADLSAGGQRLRLVLAHVVDGWLGAVVYLGTEESISLFELPNYEDAKAKAEGWARTVHGIRAAIQWIPGRPSS